MSRGHPLIFQKSLGPSLYFLKNSLSVSFKPSLIKHTTCIWIACSCGFYEGFVISIPHLCWAARIFLEDAAGEFEHIFGAGKHIFIINPDFIWVALCRNQLLGFLSANLAEIFGVDGGRTWVWVIQIPLGFDNISKSSDWKLGKIYDFCCF